TDERDRGKQHRGQQNGSQRGASTGGHEPRFTRNGFPGVYLIPGRDGSLASAGRGPRVPLPPIFRLQCVSLSSLLRGQVWEFLGAGEWQWPPQAPGQGGGGRVLRIPPRSQDVGPRIARGNRRHFARVERDCHFLPRPTDDELVVVLKQQLRDVSELRQHAPPRGYFDAFGLRVVVLHRSRGTIRLQFLHEPAGDERRLQWCQVDHADAALIARLRNPRERGDGDLVPVDLQISPDAQST